jgi:hypothetical protein
MSRGTGLLLISMQLLRYVDNLIRSGEIIEYGMNEFVFCGHLITTECII